MPVYARERKETAIQYVVTAQKLQTIVIKFLMNEKKVPKKWRFILVFGAIRKVNELLDNVVAAHNIFPNTEEKLKQRIDYLNKGVLNCYQLENRFLCMMRVIETVNAGNLGDITSLLFDEIALLKKTIKNAKVVGKQEV